MASRAFHHAFLVRDLDETRRFYVGVLGCREGRSTQTWVDLDLFGNQLTAHLGAPPTPANVGKVDGIEVPLPHFGAVVSFEEYDQLAIRLAAAGVAFVVTPRIRYPGQPGEQGTFFLLDPSGNALEFKAFRRPEAMFAP
jgi:extradiol dioxygenase family protein